MNNPMTSAEKAGESLRPADPYQRPDKDRIVSLPATVPGEPGEAIRLPSSHRLRRTVVLSVWAFTFGALLLVFQSPGRNEILAPGPLTSQHAQILAGMGGNRCSACHSAGSSNWFGWARTVVGDHAACPTSQSELCLDCHRQTIDPALAANPHALEREQLQLLTRRQETAFRVAGLELATEPAFRQLACSTCHVEHQGAMVDLTAMSDQQCQTCHTQRHRSFENGHPEFQLGGSQLPSAIRFDHQTHSAKYFPEGQREFACAACHEGDSQRNVMRLTSFEAMCSSCHAQTIRTTGQQGLVLLELPLLDLESLQAAGLEIGSWPQGARGDFAGRLHPLTWTLLSRDPALGPALKTFPAGFDFSEVDPRSQEQLGHLAELASGMKRLLLELASREFREVVGSSTGFGEAYRGEPVSPLQVFRDAVVQWFPEMAIQGAFADLEDVRSLRSETAPDRIWLPESAAIARWLQDQELLAPNPLVGKVSPTDRVGAGQAGQAEASQTASQTQSPADAGPSRQVLRGPAITNPTPQVDDNSTRGGMMSSAPPRGIPMDSAANKADVDSELLAANPLQGLVSGGILPTEGSPEEQAPAHQTDSINNLGQQRNQHAPPHKATVNQSSQAPAIEPVFSSPVTNQIPQPATLRGWKRDDRNFRLVYYVADHGDLFWPELQRWIGALQTAGQLESAAVLQQSLHQPAVAGTCFSCHRNGSQVSPAGSPGNPTQFNWKSELRRADLKGFTRFSHAPHLLQLQCTACHQLAEQLPAKPPTQLANWHNTNSDGINSNSVPSDFAPVGRATCVQCHRGNQASHSCTTCHHYHVDQTWLRVLEGTSGRLNSASAK